VALTKPMVRVFSFSSPPRMTGCTPVHGNIQNATAKAWRASSELGYRQNRHQIWCSWVSTGQAWNERHRAPSPSCDFLDRAEASSVRRDGVPVQKERATPEDRPHLPPVCGVPFRVHPFNALTARSRPQNPADQPHDATLADRFRGATTKSAVHKVVP